MPYCFMESFLKENTKLKYIVKYVFMNTYVQTVCGARDSFVVIKMTYEDYFFK